MTFRFSLCALFVVGGLAVLASCGPRPDAGGKFLLGVAAPWSPAQVGVARSARANAFRGDVSWAGVEMAAGQYAIPAGLRETLLAALGQGVDPLGLLVYGNRFYDGGLYPKSPAARAAFAGYADFAVGHLADTVELWEIWNEWNLAIGMPEGVRPGSPEDYVALLRETYATLKPRYPGKIFLGGAVAGIGRAGDWTRRACDAGMLASLDGFSFHPYVYWMSPRKRVPERGLLELVAELESLLAKYPRGAEIPLYVTELGWPTHDGAEGVTLDQQAKYLARAILLLRANSRIRGLWVYTLNDGDGSFTNRESNFGLMFADGSPKPAWSAFRDTAAVIRAATSCRRLDFPDYNDDLAGVELTDATGRRSVALWAIDEGAVFQVDLRFAARVRRTSMRTKVLGVGSGPNLALRTEEGNLATAALSATVADRPLLIEDTGALQKIEWIDMVRPGD